MVASPIFTLAADADENWQLTETEIEILWAELLAEAEAAVTVEQLAEIDSWMAAEEMFFANVTLDSLWEEFILDNPEVFELGDYEIRNVKNRIAELYEYLITANTPIGVYENLMPANTPITGAIDAYTRAFSRTDGLTNLIVRTSIEANGAVAAAEAWILFSGMRQDAFRHYYWNLLSVRDIGVGITQNGRINSTRIFTTNRELATNILRRNPSLNVSNPTAQQIATATNLRTTLLNANLATFNALFGTAAARDDLMDLWNNEMGRVDGARIGVALWMFNTRWNENTLIRSNTTTDVTAARRQQIFNNGWHRPVR